jgi:hypothetical protein
MVKSGIAASWGAMKRVTRLEWWIATEELQLEAPDDAVKLEVSAMVERSLWSKATDADMRIEAIVDNNNLFVERGEAEQSGTPKQLEAARVWLEEVFGTQTLTDRQVVDAIRRNYTGGWHQYRADA